jgi:ribose 5-phosphate isomerase A
MARQTGIPIIPFSDVNLIDIDIDGADEVDKNFNLIKGGGGALLREKIIACNSKRFIVVVDQSKLVDTLGKFPLPVEIVPFAFELTLNKLQNLDCDIQIRQKEGKIFITDNGNYIVDCSFGEIADPAKLNSLIHLIPGVVETGLFGHGMVSSVIVGSDSGVKVL